MTRLLDHLQRQIAYDDWANRETLQALAATKADSPSALRVFAHVLGAEQLWLGRIGGFAAPAPVWPSFTLADCERQIADLARRWKVLFAGLDGPWLAEPVRYVNSKGEPWSSTRRGHHPARRDPLRLSPRPDRFGAAGGRGRAALHGLHPLHASGFAAGGVKGSALPPCRPRCW